MNWRTPLLVATVLMLLHGGPVAMASDENTWPSDHAGHVDSQHTVEAEADDWLVGVETKSVGEAPGSPATAEADSSKPLCSTVEVGTPCRENYVCYPEPFLDSPGSLRIYSGVLIHGWPFGVVGGCDPSVGRAPSLSSLVRAEFERIPLPAQRVTIQPPGGRTLVNFDTILSVDAEPFTEVVRLLGRRVELRIEPSSFLWVHGDRTTQRSVSPGRAYARGVAMSEFITHSYAGTGVVQVRVDTTYSAQFRVGAGPWRPVEGTVTIEGVSVPLEVVEARPVLVGTD